MARLRDDFVLHTEEIAERPVEPLGPQVTAGLGVYELNIDANTAPVSSDGAFKHITNTELFADLLDVDILALEGERCVARNHEGPGGGRPGLTRLQDQAVGSPAWAILVATIPRTLRRGRSLTYRHCVIEMS